MIKIKMVIRIRFAVWFTTHQSLPGPPDLLYQHLSHLSEEIDLGQSSEAPGTMKLKASIRDYPKMSNL